MPIAESRALPAAHAHGSAASCPVTIPSEKATTMKRMATMLMATALLAGCATTGRLSDSERLQLYRAHAGAPVKDFHYFTSFNGWTDLGDSALAVWTRPSEAYLLTLSGPCMDLDFAPAIGVTNMMGVVSARFDRVLVYGGNGIGRVPCRIEEIRPLDVKALKVAEKELREAKAVERSDAPAQDVAPADKPAG